MKKEYSKPELIDLNEETGLGGNDCGSGSGASGSCISGNMAITGICNTGISGK